MNMWHHSPLHQLTEAGAYIVTAGTYDKQRLLSPNEKLSFFQTTLLELADLHHWSLQAWAVLSNHYHFVALAGEGADSLRTLVRHQHSVTARELNRRDGTPGRRVWFQYWETHLTFERSYYARLNYVHNNAVHHGIVEAASAYPWCSAAWFEQNAKPAFHRMIMGFKTDRLNVPDDF
jgi:putative transposase